MNEYEQEALWIYLTDSSTSSRSTNIDIVVQNKTIETEAFRAMFSSTFSKSCHVAAIIPIKLSSHRGRML